MPETFEFPDIDYDTDDSACSSKNAKSKQKSKKVKTIIKNTAPSCSNQTDYMELIAKLAEQTKRNGK